MGLNLLSGVVQSDGHTVELDGGAAMLIADPAAGAAVLIAVRPTAISVHRARPRGSSPRNSWKTLVTEVEAFGSRVRIATQGPPSIVAEITTAAMAELDLQVGQELWLSVKATELEVYGSDRISP